MAGYVFVSYSHRSDDSAYVERLAKHLTTAGVSVWFDRDAVVGDRWTELIRNKVRSSSAVIVVMTPESEKSYWVDNEIAEARLTGRPILPLLLNGERFFTLATIQYESVLDGRMPSETFVGRLSEILQNNTQGTVSHRGGEPGAGSVDVATGRPKATEPQLEINDEGGLFPDDYLHADELVRLHLHHNWQVMIMPALWSVLLIGSVAGAAFLTSDQLFIIISAVAYLVFSWRSMWPFVVWRSTHYVFTDRRLILRSGVFHPQQREVLFNVISATSSRQSFLQRLTRSGAIVLEVKGEGPTKLPNMPQAVRVLTFLRNSIIFDRERSAGRSVTRPQV